MALSSYESSLRLLHLLPHPVAGVASVYLDRKIRREAGADAEELSSDYTAWGLRELFSLLAKLSGLLFLAEYLAPPSEPDDPELNHDIVELLGWGSPTEGDWLRLAFGDRSWQAGSRCLARTLNSRSHVLVTPLVSWGVESDGIPEPMKRLLAFRNCVAHGRFADVGADLDAVEKDLDCVLQRMSFLGQGRLTANDGRTGSFESGAGVLNRSEIFIAGDEPITGCSIEFPSGKLELFPFAYVTADCASGNVRDLALYEKRALAGLRYITYLDGRLRGVADCPEASEALISRLRLLELNSAVRPEEVCGIPATRSGIIGRTKIAESIEAYAREGTGVAVLHGTSGVGKTTLLADVASRLSRDSSLVVVPFFATPDYAAARAALFTASSVAQLLMASGDRRPSMLPPSDDTRAQAWLKVALKRCVQKTGKRVFLVVDGLDLGGKPVGRDLLARIPTQMPDGCTLILGFRERGDQGLTVKVLKELFKGVTDLSPGGLAGLDESDIHVFLNESGVAGASGEMARLLREVCRGGQPLLVSHFGRMLNWVDHGDLTKFGAEPSTLAESLWHTISPDFDNLALRTMEVMSLLREPVSVEPIVEIMGESIEAVESVIASVADDWVRRLGSGALQRIEFVDVSLRDACLELLSLEERLRLHGAIADVCIDWLDVIHGELAPGTAGGFTRYAVRHTVSHLLDAGRTLEAAELLVNGEYLRNRIRQDGLVVQTPDGAQLHVSFEIESLCADLARGEALTQDSVASRLKAVREFLEAEGQVVASYPELLDAVISSGEHCVPEPVKDVAQNHDEDIYDLKLVSLAKEEFSVMHKQIFMGHRGSSIKAMCGVPNTDSVVSVDEAGRLLLWDSKTLNLIREVGLLKGKLDEYSDVDISVSSDGSRLAVSTPSGLLFGDIGGVFDTSNPIRLGFTFTGVRFIPDDPGCLAVWDGRSNFVRLKVGDVSPVRDASLSLGVKVLDMCPGGRELVVGCNNKKIAWVDVETWQVSSEVSTGSHAIVRLFCVTADSVVVLDSQFNVTLVQRSGQKQVIASSCLNAFPFGRYVGVAGLINDMTALDLEDLRAWPQRRQEHWDLESAVPVSARHLLLVPGDDERKGQIMVIPAVINGPGVRISLPIEPDMVVTDEESLDGEEKPEAAAISTNGLHVVGESDGATVFQPVGRGIEFVSLKPRGRDSELSSSCCHETASASRDGGYVLAEEYVDGMRTFQRRRMSDMASVSAPPSCGIIDRLRLRFLRRSGRHYTGWDSFWQVRSDDESSRVVWQRDGARPCQWLEWSTESGMRKLPAGKFDDLVATSCDLKRLLFSISMVWHHAIFIENARRKWKTRLPSKLVAGAFEPEGRHAYGILGNGELVRFTLEEGTVENIGVQIPSPACADLSPDGRWMLCGTQDRLLCMVDMASLKVVSRLLLPGVPTQVTLKGFPSIVVKLEEGLAYCEFSGHLSLLSRVD